MKNKRGFEIQFNWIFVLIAGAAILMFFTAVVVKQKSVSETSAKATVLRGVESIIIGAGVSTDTTNIVDIPNSDIQVRCGTISLGSLSKQYQNLILFAPSIIKGNKLITQTMPFSLPYRATNLLYLTSPQLRYIIIGSTQLAEEVNKSLPSSIKKEFYSSMPQIKNENNYRVRFVVFEDMIDLPESLERMPDSDVSALRVVGDNEKGTVEFYQKRGTLWLLKGSFVYIGKQSLIGAVYADTIDLYECSMKNTLLRLNFITKIQTERTNKLIELASSRRDLQCYQFYNKALTHLNSIYSESTTFPNIAVDAISDSAKSLANENKNAQVYSCASLY